MNRFRFAPASQSERIVFGARRPGYPTEQVQDWLAFMSDNGIQRVCCLLSREQLDDYAGLLETYRQALGAEKVCWAPIQDFHLADAEILTERILPFLRDADRKGERVVVHCAGGLGRTGHVLAAWLVCGRGFSVEEAIAAVEQMCREPREAVACGNATEEELHALLRKCRPPTR
jgi:protein-tyrosine phosphatase